MLLNIDCLIQACRQLQLPYDIISTTENLVAVQATQLLYFASFTTPANCESLARICKDKGYTYELLKDTVNVPPTKIYLDPHCPTEYQDYAEFSSHETILRDILHIFPLPCILKRGNGSKGQHVFVCQNQEEILPAIQEVFNPQSKEYDYLLLAQNYIEKSKEYRVVIVHNQVELVYEKNIDEATFVGNVSPLHYENARSIVISDPELLQRLQTFVQPITQTIPLGFIGLDIIEDQQGTFWLIEMNSQPGFNDFVKHNGKDRVVEVYRKLLSPYLNI
jgi:glutathione synthase/RimK-type ligase-like ATP-grasp enzyme